MGKLLGRKKIHTTLELLFFPFARQKQDCRNDKAKSVAVYPL